MWFLEMCFVLVGIAFSPKPRGEVPIHPLALLLLIYTYVYNLLIFKTCVYTHKQKNLYTHKYDYKLTKMGRINFVIPDEIEDKFRQEVYKSKGMKKGNISKAIKEAILLWMNTEQKKRSNAAKKAWETRRKKE